MLSLIIAVILTIVAFACIVIIFAAWDEEQDQAAKDRELQRRLEAKDDLK